MDKDRPLASALKWLAIIVGSGTALGIVFSIIQGKSIAQGVRRDNPNDPLDLLPFLVWGFIVVGFIGSTLLGLLVAILVYLTKRNEIADRKLAEQGSES
jgi:hypothetical protein